MKKLIISTFVLGLSTSAFANAEDLGEIYNFDTPDQGHDSMISKSEDRSGSQPAVGSNDDVYDLFKDGNS